MMSVNGIDTTDLARLLPKIAGFHRSLHCQVGIIFAWI